MATDNEDVIYVIDGSGPDGLVQVGDDLKKEVIETIGSYLRKKSKEENKFKISAEISKIDIRNSNGDPAPIDDSLNGSSNPYAKASSNPQIKSYSDSGKIFSPTIGAYLTKGKADTLLKDISGFTDKSGKSAPITESDIPIFQAIDIALNNNRFSPGVQGAFISEGSPPSVLGRSQAEFGKHNIDGKDLKIEELKQIGFSLMFRAAKEIKAVQEGDPRKVGVGLGALIPGAAQIALLRPDTNDLRASAVMKENFGIDKPRTDTEPVINSNTKSWGSLNTPFEPYGGFLPIGMTILSVAMAIAIRVVSLAFIGFLSLIVKEKLAKIPNRGPFIIGQYGKENPPGALFSLSAIGIRPTERDFLTVVNEGLDVFFEFDGASFKRAVREPQFYTIFVRNIIRSGNTIIQSIQDVFQSGQNPVAAAQSFLGLVDVLKSSKIIAFLNILAQIGDRAAEMREQGFDTQEGKKSILENFDPKNPATNVMRIRNGRSDLKSGMRTSATLSKFVFPLEVLRAGGLLASDSKTNIDKALAALPENHVALESELDGNGRIKKEVVAKIESELDSEYVPFYFHDLRTNEIISFHAFLDSLEDQYQPNYESSVAYGRIDNVRTYISTERTLSLTFNILSTSKDDFDVMWFKINKLISLVYPSWTEGREVSAGDKKFIQPFSQLPASTPLIRLRIGDLIRSNFSKFSLFRLFGVGSDKTNLLESETISDAKALEDKKKNILKIRERMLRNPATNSSSDGYKAGETAVLLPKRTGYMEADDPNPLKKAARAKALFAQKPRRKLVITASTRVKILGITSLGASLGIGGSNSGASIDDYGEHKIAYYKIEVADAVSDEMNGEFLVSHDDLVPDQDQIVKLAEGSTLSESGDLGATTLANVDDVLIFDGSDSFRQNNIIVKSFESVQGKGLGGVITSLNMSELASPTSVWETSEFGSRAPKIVKITMTFAVIHDIAPGLDSSGFMRAMQYPVGNVARHINGDTYMGDSENNAEKLFNDNHQKVSISLRNENKKNGLKKAGLSK